MPITDLVIIASLGLGLLVSILWLIRYDGQGIMSNPQRYKTHAPPASIGFFLLSFTGLLLFVVISQGAAYSVYALIVWGWMVVALGIFFPHVFLPRGQLEWRLIPPWVKWFSRSLAVLGILPTLALILLDAYKKNQWLGIGGTILVILFLIWKRKKYLDVTQMDPAATKAVKVYFGLEGLLSGLLFLLLIGLIIGHLLKFW